MNNTSQSARSLFPPRDFVATALVWGFWAAGLMAGLNYIWLGQQKRGRYTIVLAMLAQLLLWAIMGLWRVGFGPLFNVGNEPWELRPNPGVWLCTFLIIAINGMVGYRLYILQRDTYARWLAEHAESTGSPYVAWQVVLLVLICTLITVVALWLIFFGLD